MLSSQPLTLQYLLGSHTQMTALETFKSEFDHVESGLALNDIKHQKIYKNSAHYPDIFMHLVI